MPVSWFISPYERDDLVDGIFILRHRRRPAVIRFLPQITADGGNLAFSEGLGDQAVCKVLASQATLDLIAAETGFLEIPRRWTRLLDSLATMTNGERNQIQNKLISLGFTQAEIDGVMGNTLAQWRTHALVDLLNLFTLRRFTPRRVGNVITLDGPQRACRPISDVDAKVTDA